MLRTFIPRLWAYSFTLMMVVNLGFMFGSGYIETEEIPHKAELARLLKWIDPSTGQPIHLPVDRTAPLATQVYQLNQITVLEMQGTSLYDLQPEIGALVNLKELYLTNNSLRNCQQK